MMVTVAVGLQSRPSTAPKDQPWASDYKLAGNPSFTSAISAVSSLVYAYAGTPGKLPEYPIMLRPIANRRTNSYYTGFFPIAAEMRDPSLYTRPLLICQGSITAIYITVGTVIYYYCGSYVASPALGSAGVLIKKVSYGIALPGLVVSTIVVLHVSC